jgi:hypothetical protein
VPEFLTKAKIVSSPICAFANFNTSATPYDKRTVPLWAEDEVVALPAVFEDLAASCPATPVVEQTKKAIPAAAAHDIVTIRFFITLIPVAK